MMSLPKIFGEDIRIRINTPSFVRRVLSEVKSFRVNKNAN